MKQKSVDNVGIQFSNPLTIEDYMRKADCKIMELKECARKITASNESFMEAA